MAVDIGFGIDTSVLSGPDEDLDDTFTEMNGVEILLEDVAKALDSPPQPVLLVDGELCPITFWEDPPVSFSLMNYLKASLTEADESTLAARVEAIYDGDQRFSSFSASVDADFAGGTLAIGVQGQASGTLLSASVVAGTSGITVVPS